METPDPLDGMIQVFLPEPREMFSAKIFAVRAEAAIHFVGLFAAVEQLPEVDCLEEEQTYDVRRHPLEVYTVYIFFNLCIFERSPGNNMLGS